MSELPRENPFPVDLTGSPDQFYKNLTVHLAGKTNPSDFYEEAADVKQSLCETLPFYPHGKEVEQYVRLDALVDLSCGLFAMRHDSSETAAAYLLDACCVLEPLTLLKEGPHVNSDLNFAFLASMAYANCLSSLGEENAALDYAIRGLQLGPKMPTLILPLELRQEHQRHYEVSLVWYSRRANQLGRFEAISALRQLAVKKEMRPPIVPKAISASRRQLPTLSWQLLEDVYDITALKVDIGPLLGSLESHIQTVSTLRIKDESDQLLQRFEIAKTNLVIAELLTAHDEHDQALPNYLTAAMAFSELKYSGLSASCLVKVSGGLLKQARAADSIIAADKAFFGFRRYFQKGLAHKEIIVSFHDLCGDYYVATQLVKAPHMYQTMLQGFIKYGVVEGTNLAKANPRLSGLLALQESLRRMTQNSAYDPRDN